MVPKRPNWDGLMPVPGDGRYEWAGLTHSSGLPRSYNPAGGWLGTANQMNLPPDYDYKTLKTGFEWPNDGRYVRLAELLEAKSEWSVADTQGMQIDCGSIPARRLCRLLAGLSTKDTAAAKGLKLLAGWDHDVGADSGPAALFEVWFSKHLIPGVLNRLGPAGLTPMVTVPDSALVVDLLEKADPGFGADAAAARDALLLETLAGAWVETTKRLGADPAGWAWGQIHQGRFRHPLSRLAPAKLKAKLDVGPAPKGGSNLTINNNGYRTSDFEVVSGVSWRMVVDVGNWDASWVINSPGQSGDPASPHYRDLFPIWARDGYVPMVYSRAAVEAAAEQRIRLVPAAN